MTWHNFVFIIVIFYFIHRKEGGVGETQSGKGSSCYSCWSRCSGSRGTVAIVVQLDFNTAFTSMNMNVVYRTLETHRLPEAEIALLKLERLQSGS